MVSNPSTLTRASFSQARSTLERIRLGRGHSLHNPQPDLQYSTILAQSCRFLLISWKESRKKLTTRPLLRLKSMRKAQLNAIRGCERQTRTSVLSTTTLTSITSVLADKVEVHPFATGKVRSSLNTTLSPANRNTMVALSSSKRSRDSKTSFTMRGSIRIRLESLLVPMRRIGSQMLGRPTLPRGKRSSI